MKPEAIENQVMRCTFGLIGLDLEDIAAFCTVDGVLKVVVLLDQAHPPRRGCVGEPAFDVDARQFCGSVKVALIGRPISRQWETGRNRKWEREQENKGCEHS